jgi:hypothetical protein
MREILPAGRSRQAEGRGHDRHRSRDGRLHLGDRPRCPAWARLTRLLNGTGEREAAKKAKVRTAGDRTTVGNPRACYEPVSGPMLDLRARQPRDGTTVMRYPTRA